MSDLAAEYYGEHFGLEGEALERFIAPAATDITANNPRGVDIHYWRDSEKVQTILGVGMYRHVADNFRTTHRRASEAGAIDPDNTARNLVYDVATYVTKQEFGARLSRALITKRLVTGKVLSLGMEAVDPEELPDSVRNGLAAKAVDSGKSKHSPRGIEAFDTWYGVYGTARVGGYVGNLACGILVRPRVDTWNEAHRVSGRISYMPFPAREVSASLLDRANRVAAATQDGIQNLNTHRG